MESDAQNLHYFYKAYLHAKLNARSNAHLSIRVVIKRLKLQKGRSTAEGFHFLHFPQNEGVFSYAAGYRIEVLMQRFDPQKMI